MPFADVQGQGQRGKSDCIGWGQKSQAARDSHLSVVVTSCMDMSFLTLHLTFNELGQSPFLNN
jgi:hypothetical protein